MNTELLERKFSEMGARAKVRQRDLTRWENRGSVSPLGIDIAQDKRGSYFDIVLRGVNDLDLSVLDVRPSMRHLLLMARLPQNTKISKEKFLCGHDERDWFVAAVPGQSASTVVTAMEALKPQAVIAAQSTLPMKQRDKVKRHTDAYIRQGEWFFLPEPGLIVKNEMVLRNEPLSRGRGSKPHMLEMAYRTGGQTVYVNSQYPNGIDGDAYAKLVKRNPEVKRQPGWRIMQKDPVLYAKGTVRHADHKTVFLTCWHRVVMNRENEAPAMRHVVFLD